MGSDCLFFQNPTSDSRGDVASDADTQPSSSSAEEPATIMEGHGVYDMDWVSCPVCDRSIRGTNHNVNSHIGRLTSSCLVACSLNGEVQPVCLHETWLFS